MHGYLEITKPRMVLVNVIVAAAAFIYGSHSAINWELFWYMAVGLTLVVASGCVFNNVHDRTIDARMERTKNRALPSGRVSPAAALALGGILLALGALVLWYTNLLALILALLGFVVYVFLYTPLKHRSAYALFVGAVAGAMPPLVGYAAAGQTIDTTAVMLFGALFLWQLPHFVAIAYYRFDEYKAAKVPLLIHHAPSERARRIARSVFYASLVILLLFCVGLILQR